MSEHADQIWKTALHALFRHMVLFYFPPLYSRINWSREHIFVEQELANLSTPEQKNKRYVDILAQVFLLDGADVYILLHVEVQGYGSGETAVADFEQRMFTYFYRIRDKWGCDVVALAILTDGNGQYRPGRYEYSHFGTKLTYVFNVSKVIDYNEGELEDDPNPFATLMLAAKRSLKAGQSDDETKRIFKTKLVRLMVAKGHDREDIRALFEFIEWMAVISDAKMASRYLEEIRAIAKKEGDEMVFLGNYAQSLIAEKVEKEEKTLLLLKEEREKTAELEERARLEIERERENARRLAAELEERARLELKRMLLSQAAEMLDAGEPEEKILRFVKLPRELLDELIASRRN